MRTRVRRGLVVMVGVIALAFGGLAPAGASGGALDPSFGDAGKVVTPFASDAWANAVALQPDGMVVAAGSAAGYFALARYDTNGVLDPSFGTGGVVTTSVSPGFDEVRSVAMAADGKIVVAGSAADEVIAVARYDTDGVLDPSFGTGGIVTVDLTHGFDLARSVLIQDNGKIVAVGSSGTFPPKWALVRFDTSGVLDPSFGRDGIVITKFGIWGEAGAAALQPNQRIVVAGFDGSGLALARYLPHGALDPSFGDAGKVSGKNYRLAFANAVALQPDGKILVGGDMDIFHFALARYTPRGKLDPTFGGDGRVMTYVGSGEQGVRGLALLPSGRIVAAGYAAPHEAGDPVEPRIVLAKYRTNGSPDLAFGVNGVVATYIGDGAAGGGIVRQPDGRLVVAGSADVGGSHSFAVVRYLA